MGILNDFDSGLPIMEDWLQTQQHLPQFMEKILLKRFIYACNGDLEKAKKLIDLNYTMRTNHPQVFSNRDPYNETAQNILQVTDMLVLPGVTPNGNKVLFYRLADIDPEKFNFTEAIKMFFIFADLRFATRDPMGLTNGEVPVFDMTGYSLRHLGKLVLSSLRVYMKFTQEAHPVRLREIHVINCPSFLDKVLMVIKPFMRSEVFKLMKFHLPGSDSLYEFVPKEMLPNEYGGQAGKIQDIKSSWLERLYIKRDYIMDEKNWKVIESKRHLSKQQKQNNNIHNGGNVMIGSFQTLSID